MSGRFDPTNDGVLGVAWVGAIVAAVTVHFAGLGYDEWSVDELYYRRAGHEYLAGTFGFNREHPPLGKLLIGLSEAVLGQGPFGTRFAAAAAALLTGVVLALLAWRIAGRWAGLAAFATWALLPHPTLAIDVGREALLDTFMVLGIVVALERGWCWARTGRWRPALAAALAVGLASAAKLPALLDAPIVVALALAALPTWRTARQAAAATGVAAVAFLVPYGIYGTRLPATIAYMVRFQLHNSARGHLVKVGGVAVTHPPWWYGPMEIFDGSRPVAIAYALSLLLAPVVLPRRAAVYLLAAVLVPFCFFAFLTGVQLRHYPYDYMAPLALVTALVIVHLARGARRSRLLAAVMAAPLAVLAIVAVTHGLTRGPGQTEKAARLVQAYSTRRSLVIVDEGRTIFSAYLRDPGRVVEATRRPPGAIVTDETPAEMARDLRLRGLHRHDVGTLHVWLRALPTPWSGGWARTSRIRAARRPAGRSRISGWS